MSHEINIINQNGVAMVSSRIVAKDFGKRHTEVLRTIETKLENAKLRSQNYFIESQYKAEGNNKTYKEYLMTRDGFTFIVMGFTGEKADEFKLKYIEAFNKMEELIKQAGADPYANLSLELKAIIMHDAKIMKLEQRMTNFEENARLDNAEYDLVGRRVIARVKQVEHECGMKLNQKQRSELYRSLNKDVHTIAKVRTRTQLQRKHLEMVLEFIEEWQPSQVTLFKVKQLSLEF